jgi:hypothetical protein
MESVAQNYLGNKNNLVYEKHAKSFNPYSIERGIQKI